jgi:hypothetical protein
MVNPGVDLVPATVKGPAPEVAMYTL